MKTTSKIGTLLMIFLMGTFKAQNNIQLKANTEDGQLSLQWSTAKEVNSSYFIVESSNDNKTFEAVGKVKAVGYSLTTKNYTFESLNEKTPALYYRVLLVNMEGGRVHSLALSTYSTGETTLLAHNKGF